MKPHLSLRGGVIRFGDGRHRFAWVRDHGAQALPVGTDPALAQEMAERYGSDLRACVIRLGS